MFKVGSNLWKEKKNLYFEYKLHYLTVNKFNDLENNFDSSLQVSTLTYIILIYVLCANFQTAGKYTLLFLLVFFQTVL